MTPEEINKAIAKHAGWYVITPPPEDGTTAFRLCHPTETTVYPWCESEEEAFTHAPDFMNNLDAIRPIELKARCRCDVFGYDHYLAIAIAKRKGLDHPYDVKADDLVLASAADRAETCLYILTNFKHEA